MFYNEDVDMPLGVHKGEKIEVFLKKKHNVVSMTGGNSGYRMLAIEHVDDAAFAQLARGE